jgi:hypothetical protein
MNGSKVAFSHLMQPACSFPVINSIIASSTATVNSTRQEKTRPGQLLIENKRALPHV